MEHFNQFLESFKQLGMNEALMFLGGFFVAMAIFEKRIQKLKGKLKVALAAAERSLYLNTLAISVFQRLNFRHRVWEIRNGK